MSKREVLNQVVTAELRNGTGIKDTLVVEKSVSDTRSTANAFTADWTLFGGALKLGVSRTVTNEHTISGVQQARVDVDAGRKVLVRGMVRTWYVKSEVTARNSNCAYKTYQVQGEVATTDDIVWITKDIGRA
ncbi:hypothetical protein [Amycolatopsis sp. NPDC059657]|uniref:hypothetical protein n=1 Tax=Amycolatopsis sp. NPDC059657 TaxID=3346899 RepID=UPI00366C616B